MVEVFCPKSINLPKVVKAVKLRYGIISFADWINGISEKTQEMLFLERNPKKVADRVCSQLGLPPCEDIEQFGLHLLTNDSKFRNHISQFRELFPIVFSENNCDPQDKAFYKVHIEKWADTASRVHELPWNYFLHEDPDIFPSEEIRPYIDFFEDNLFVWSDFVDLDENKCTLHSYFYDFSLDLTVKDDFVVLSYFIPGKRDVPYREIKNFELDINHFNSNHIPTLYCRHEMLKKSVFSKPMYKVHYFVLVQKWLISANIFDVIRFVSTFYLCLLDLFQSKYFSFPLPMPNKNGKIDSDFVEHLNLLLVVFHDCFSTYSIDLEEEVRGSSDNL